MGGAGIGGPGMGVPPGIGGGAPYGKSGYPPIGGAGVGGEAHLLAPKLHHGS